MNLSRDIRIQIADRIIIILIPILLICMIINTIGLFFWGQGQTLRMIPFVIATIMCIPAWQLRRKGRPLTGVLYILAGLCLAIVFGMVASGGVRALSFMAGLVCVTLFVVLYGIRGGIIFTCVLLGLGSLFAGMEHLGILPRAGEPPLIYSLMINAMFLSMQICFVLIPVRLMVKALDSSRSQSRELANTAKERRQAQKYLQSILSKTPDVIYRLDPTGKVTFVNDAISLYGYEPEAFVGQDILDLIHPQDREGARHQIMERRTGDRGATHLEVRFQKRTDAGTSKETKENRWVVFQIASDGIYAEETQGQENYIGVQGVARDISTTRQYEARIDQLAAVVEQAAEDVVITDPHGIILYVNPKFETLTGYSIQEVVGKNPRILKSGKHDRAFYQNLWAGIKAGNTWEGRIWNRKKDRSLMLQDVTITPIFDSSQTCTGYVSVRRDITEQQQFEENIKQAQKMEAIGTLAGGIAHDFNNILTGIFGFTQLASANKGNPQKTADHLKQIKKGAQRATELVQQILTFSRQSKFEKHPFVVYLAVNEALKFLRSSIPSTIDIQQQLDSRAMVLADPTKIYQVVMNLCTNAYHAMSKTGGVLRVTLEDMDIQSPGPIKDQVLPPGNYLYFGVSDTGQGMDEPTLAKAFTPYYTTKRQGHGTGLGLSLVLAIVQEHEGFIDVSSMPGKGTDFHLYFPVSQQKPGRDRPKETQTPVLNGKETIMIVDDEEAIRKIYQDFFKRFGYRVYVYQDGVEAFEAFEADPQKFDLILTDMTMPRMAGDEFSRQCLKLRPEIPIILCTGFSENLSETQALELGIQKYVNKPVGNTELLTLSRELLDRPMEQ